MTVFLIVAERHAVGGIAGHVPRSVIAIAGELIVRQSGDTEIFG